MRLQEIYLNLTGEELMSVNKRTNKYNLKQILENKDTIYIFDIDGTLTDFNY